MMLSSHDQIMYHVHYACAHDNKSACCRNRRRSSCCYTEIDLEVDAALLLLAVKNSWQHPLIDIVIFHNTAQ